MNRSQQDMHRKIGNLAIESENRGFKNLSEELRALMVRFRQNAEKVNGGS